MSSSALAPPLPRIARWPLHLACLGGGIGLWFVAYWNDIATAVQIWWISPTYSHCFLIVPISAWLIWRRRERLKVMAPEFSIPGLLLLPPLGMAWFLGHSAAINEVAQLAAMAMFEAMVLALLGWPVFRALLFPLLFLMFLVPVGQYLVPPLQSLTTWFVSEGLTALGILHYTEGNVIQLANGNFEVAEACAGLRFLIANMVLGTLFAYGAFRRPYKIGLFMLASAAIPVVANCLRALGIVLIAHWSNNHLAVGADHLVYGWGFSMLILLGLFLIAARFRDTIPRDTALPASAPAPASGWIAVAAVFFLCAPPALAQFREDRAAVPAFQLLPKPGWSVAASASPWAPDLPPADKSFTAALRRQGGSAVDVRFDYYRGGGKDHGLIVAPERLWDERRYNLVRSGEARPRIAGRPVRFAEFLLNAPNESRLVWWSYWKDGAFTQSGAAIKWMGLRQAFSGESGAGLVALSTRVTGDLNEARARLSAASWALSPLAKDAS